MRNTINLTEGKIFNTLFKLALPLMGTSFIQMAYNLTDLMWLGRLSTDAVAAAGAVGILAWFGSGIMLISKIGVGIFVAQSYGEDDIKKAREYAVNGLKLDIFLGVTFGLILLLFRKFIIGFFNLESKEVFDMSIKYLSIIAIGMPFNFMNPVFSNILNSSGDSITPFKINTIGLIANMVLDPLLIFGIGSFNGLGIKGAALATISAQIIVSLVFIYVGKKSDSLYSNLELLKKPNFEYIKDIAKVGYPPFLQTSVQATIAMLLARIITKFGDVGIAVQSIGTQIESLSWMTAEGFSSAISAFVGQNYGARKYDRIDEGYTVGRRIVGSIGLFTALLLIFAAEPIFKIFTPEDKVAIYEGTRYLRILGYSQFFLSIEIGTAGVFNGLGKTIIPASIAVFFNILRIPMAIIFSKKLGLVGVWWAVSISTICKGIILPALYRIIIRERLVKGNI